MPHDAKQSVLFPDLLSKPLHVCFDEPDTTSDGGAIVLKAVDERMGLTERLAQALDDRRQPGKILHDRHDLVRQRVFGLACGYADTNDVARIGNDPMQKIVLDRHPIEGDPLASQPTLCRFENHWRRTDLYRMGTALVDSVVSYHKKRLRRKKVKRITVDLDLTDDLTHGNQQLRLFNTHYGGWCYLPLLGFLTFNDEPEQYLCAALLRPGKSGAARETIALLKRLVPRLRQAYPKTKIRVRLDGGFSGPEILNALEKLEVEYLVAIAKNSVLDRRAGPLLQLARQISKRSGRTSAQFGETWYAARSWKKKQRRVIFKAEIVRLAGRKPRSNPRFVVTNLPVKPESIYKIYRARGDCENRIKELLHDLEIDRTSCHRFWANQFRVLLTATAYVLFQTLRSRIGEWPSGRAQIGTLRLRLIKIGARVERTVRRIVLHLSAHHPWKREWRRVALAWGARPP